MIEQAIELIDRQAEEWSAGFKGTPENQIEALNLLAAAISVLHAADALEHKDADDE